ncbi:hypothetical protein cypCar_00022600 [Cyprinus carpio]|nr:hypothetical protein cypCar_00022600 [Cyprinus carpio]
MSSTGAGVKDCLFERRQVLSRLFYGPAGDFSKSNVFSVSKDILSFLGTCSSEFQELLANSGLHKSLPKLERPNVRDILAEVLQGMFPSGALSLKTLALAPNPKRLHENLFAGKLINNAANFNYTGTVGNCGPTSCQATATQQFLSTVRSVLSDPSSVTQLSEVYIPRCAYDGSWHQIQCDGPPGQAIEFYHEWVRIINSGQDLSVSEALGILRTYAGNLEAKASFRTFVSELFKAGHHRVFPVLARFEKISDISSDMLDGNVEAIYGPSFFLRTVCKTVSFRYSRTTFRPFAGVVCPGWCFLQKSLALQREVGVGYEPLCVQDRQRFSPLQCDLSAPFLSPASCVIPRPKTGLMLLHYTTPARLILSGQTSSVAVCEDSSVSLECLNDKEVTATHHL